VDIPNGTLKESITLKKSRGGRGFGVICFLESKLRVFRDLFW
jgi:hypothetical protein